MTCFYICHKETANVPDLSEIFRGSLIVNYQYYTPYWMRFFFFSLRDDI